MIQNNTHTQTDTHTPYVKRQTKPFVKSEKQASQAREVSGQHFGWMQHQEPLKIDLICKLM